jgi:hypothetical protein
MEPDTLQVARFFKNPGWGAHYRDYLPDISECLQEEANRLLLNLCLRIYPELEKPTPEELLDCCVEESFNWAAKDAASLKVTPQQVAKRSLIIRELLQKPENGLTAERAFRAWLQRNITAQAASAEPHMGSNGVLTDPIFNASEKLTTLSVLTLACKGEEEEIFFPLANTKLEYRPQVPLGIDVFDSGEWGGGPEFDTVLTLAGETNVGKTMLGLYIISCLSAQKKNVLLVSGEDSPEENRRRLLCHYLRATASEIRAMSELERQKRMEELYGDPEDPDSLHHHLRTRMSSVCPDEGRLTPKFLQEQLDRVENKIGEPIHGVMIDYLQKCRLDNPNKKMQRDEELEVFVNTLVEIGHNKHLTLLISQIPSHAAGGATEFLGIKQATARSYAATWGSHYIITMNRTMEETHRLRSSTDKRPRINLFLCKNKNGPIGTCYALGILQESRWRFFRDQNDLKRFTQNHCSTGGPQGPTNQGPSPLESTSTHDTPGSDHPTRPSGPTSPPSPDSSGGFTPSRRSSRH